NPKRERSQIKAALSYICAGGGSDGFPPLFFVKKILVKHSLNRYHLFITFSYLFFTMGSQKR
ncbi:hypothetical protein ACFYVU_16845, partial [Bacillus velezensis]